MSMEEFIREIETNPSTGQSGGLGGAGNGNELITVRSTRKVKDPKSGETRNEEYIDVDGKTRLVSPTSYTVAQVTSRFLQKVFGNREGVQLLNTFLDERFPINMISKDGLSRQEQIQIKQQIAGAESAQKSLLERLTKM